MESWRRHKGEFNHQDVLGTRLNPRKPPTGNWQQRVQTVPSWEKKFCFVVGSVPWKKLVETKKYMHLYQNVVKWNDSAGKDAFQDAKNRFWAEMNGLPCDAPSDPDVYIDKIDWDSKIDEELILDLEEESMPVEGHKDDDVIIIGDPLLLNPTFSCVGWGEAEEDFKKKTDLTSGTSPRVQDDDTNPWESSCAHNHGTSKSQHNNSWDVNNDGSDRVWGTWEKKKDWSGEASGLSMSRYKTTRYHGDDHQVARGGRGGRGKPINSSCEESFSDRKLWRQWRGSYCRPVSYGVAEKAGNAWGW